MKPLNIKQFTLGAAISAVIAAVLFCASYTMGKNEFFLFLNTDLGTAADYFFGIFTNTGDASMWVVVLLITLFVLKQKKAWPLLVSAFVLSTIFTQASKYIFYPDAPRPFKAIVNHSLIHTVSFVKPLSISSFPSGHTAAAFSIYLVLCLLLRSGWWLAIGLLYAVAVGYSRIYLAQHFPFDVAAGITVAIVSVFLSLLIQRAVFNKSKN
jgi:membrane-associated phospholipid phosphatase